MLSNILFESRILPWCFERYIKGGSYARLSVSQMHKMCWFANSCLSRVAHKIFDDGIQRRNIVIRENLKALWFSVDNDEISDKFPSFFQNTKPTIFASIPTNQRRNSNTNESSPDHVWIVYFKLFLIFWLSYRFFFISNFGNNICICLLSVTDYALDFG